MTTPFDLTDQLRKLRSAQGEAAAGMDEYRSFTATNQQAIQGLLAEIQQAGQIKHVPNPLDPSENPDRAHPVQQFTPDQQKDLVERGKFWNIPNPENMRSDDLMRAIQRKKLGIKPEENASVGERALLLGLSAATAAGSLFREIGMVANSVEKAPLAGQYLSKILGVEKARTWLNSVASQADEANQVVQRMSPTSDKTAQAFVTGAGKFAGYALPAMAAWEGIGVAGAGWLGDASIARASSPLMRLAARGALTSLLFSDPDSSTGEQIAQVGLGAILGPLNMAGRLGVAAGFGVAGAGLGNSIGETQNDRTRHAIEFGLGAATLGFFAPTMSSTFGKVKSGFRGPLDEAVSEAMAPPGEVDVTSSAEITPADQVSGNPPTKALPFSQQRLLGSGEPRVGPGASATVGADPSPADVSAAIRSEPTMVLGPDGVPTLQEGNPRIAGLLEAPGVSGHPSVEYNYDLAHEYQLKGKFRNDPNSLTVSDAKQHYQITDSDWSRMSEQDHASYLEEMKNSFSNASRTPEEYQYLSDNAFGAAQQKRTEVRQSLALRNSGLAGITNGPTHLLGSKVADSNGNPLRVYHGTPESFQEFDPQKLDGQALYGPGFYHTESLSTAEGYTRMDEVEIQPDKMDEARKRILDAAGKLQQPMPNLTAQNIDQTNAMSWAADLEGLGAPVDLNDLVYPLRSSNIRPAFLSIKNPFNIDHTYSQEEVSQLMQEMEKHYPDWDFQTISSRRQRLAGQNGGMRGDDIYDMFEDAEKKESYNAKLQAQAPPDKLWFTNPYLLNSNNATFGKEGVNAALQSLGFDGITHIGGAITGNAPHRVWIAFRPDQIHPPYMTDGLDIRKAIEQAIAMKKVSTVMESADLPNAVAASQVGDTHVVAAAKSINPGGVSIVQGIGSPLEVLADHPDIHYVWRDGRLDALVGPVTDAQMGDYEKYGLFEGQHVVTANGHEGTVISPSSTGNKVVIARESGPPLRVNGTNVLPSRFGAPQVSAPDLWHSFKADLLGTLHRETEAAGMKPVESLFDPRVGEAMQNHLWDYLNRRGINDDGVRQVISEHVNREFVEEAKNLDPEAKKLQSDVTDAMVQAMNDREDSASPLPVSLEEKAEARGFIWITDPGKPGGTLKDNLNPMSGQEVPMETDQAAEEFLKHIDRSPPDVTLASDVPQDVSENTPNGSKLESHLPMDEYLQMFEEAMKDSDEHLDGLEGAAAGGGAAGGGGGKGPTVYDNSNLGGQFPHQPTGPEQFERLRADDPNRWFRLASRWGTNALRYMRYHMQSFEKDMAANGMDNVRPWKDYDALETGKTLADNNSHPWLSEYGSDIQRSFPRRIRRDGSVLRIHSIEDPNARYAAWYRLGETHGYGDSQIKKFIEADGKLGNLLDRYFGSLTGDESLGQGSSRELLRYTQHVRARQATGNADPYDSTGLLGENTKFFADYARENNLQFRTMDVDQFVSHTVRAGMFEKYAGDAWNTFNANWNDSRVPADMRNAMTGWARQVKYGYDPSGDLAARGIKTMVGFLSAGKLQIKNSEAARLLGVPQGFMYMSMLAGRASIFFREATLPLIAATKVNAPIMTDVVADMLHGEKLADMYKNGIAGGWIMKETPTMEGSAPFQERTQDSGETFSPAEQARRETLNRILDVGADNLPTWLRNPQQSKLNTLTWYSEHIQRLRMIVGESAHRQATTGLAEYRSAELDAALHRDPSRAMSYDELADATRFSSFSTPIQRRFQELVANGDDKEAANLFARQTADWSLGRFANRESPKVFQSGFGRMVKFLGNTSFQYLEQAVNALGNGLPKDRARYLMINGAFAGAMYYLKEKTGWGFDRWIWPNMLKYIPSPVVEKAVEGYAAWQAQVALSEDRTPAPWQQKALQDVARNGFLPRGSDFNPYAGYFKTAEEYTNAAQGINPLEQAARFTVTGDRGSAIDLRREQTNEADRLRQLIQQHDSATMANHPGAGALP